MKTLRVALVPLALLALAVPAAPAAAQGADFSGTWRLDADASELPDFGGGARRLFGGGGGGRRGGGGGGLGGAATLVIVQTPAMLIIEQQSDRGSRAVTYRLDGEESTSSGPRGEQTSRSRWDGAALVTEGAQSVSTPRGRLHAGVQRAANAERRRADDDGRDHPLDPSRRHRHHAGLSARVTPRVGLTAGPAVPPPRGGRRVSAGLRGSYGLRGVPTPDPRRPRDGQGDRLRR